MQGRQARCQLGYYYSSLTEGGREEGVGCDVLIRSYLFHLPPPQDNGPFVDTCCHGGSCRSPQDTDGVIMLCHNWLAQGSNTTIITTSIRSWLRWWGWCEWGGLVVPGSPDWGSEYFLGCWVGGVAGVERRHSIIVSPVQPWPVPPVSHTNYPDYLVYWIWEPGTTLATQEPPPPPPPPSPPVTNCQYHPPPLTQHYHPRGRIEIFFLNV